MDDFKSVINKINKLLKVARPKDEFSHAQNTLKWVKLLAKEPSQALVIAALAHDIERWSREDREHQRANESYDEYKRRHSNIGAEIISNLLSQFNFSKDFIAQVADLVREHEFGGNTETNILQDADSISFFDNNLDYYLKRNGYKRTAEKVKWMFNRCSKRAQAQIVQLPKYQIFSKLNPQ